MLINIKRVTIGILVLFSIVLTVSFINHNQAVAKFDFFHENGTVRLNVEVEQRDLEFVVKDVTIRKLNAHLKKQVSWFLNDKKILFEVDSLELEGHHYFIYCSSEEYIDEVTQIDVHNTFLLTRVHHSNIMSFYVNDKKRSFRMHKGRKKIQLRY